jgi:type III restriction enzyme
MVSINHYPDFIVKTTSGKLIILEAKGDDRDNSDSIRKLKLGNAWEKQAGRQFRYFMVFDNKPIEGAHKLADAFGLLGQLLYVDREWIENIRAGKMRGEVR